MEEPRIIKKYPNRRLYDTAVSRYITLDEIKELVTKHIKFKIVDARSNEDMTNYVLLQIITEQEGGHSPLFTTEILLNIIRFYGHPIQKTMRQFLEQSFTTFSTQQADIKTYFDNLTNSEPYRSLAEVAKQNMEKWQSTFTDYFEKNSPSKQQSKSTKRPTKQRKKPA